MHVHVGGTLNQQVRKKNGHFILSLRKKKLLVIATYFSVQPALLLFSAAHSMFVVIGDH